MNIATIIQMSAINVVSLYVIKATTGSVSIARFFTYHALHTVGALYVFVEYNSTRGPLHKNLCTRGESLSLAFTLWQSGSLPSTMVITF